MVEFSTWFEAAERVTPYATLYRYPGEDLEPAQEEFDQALTAAEGLCDFVLSVLPEEVHPDKSHRQSQEKRNSAPAVESAGISAEAEPPPNVPPESSGSTPDGRLILLQCVTPAHPENIGELVESCSRAKQDLP
ncbi:MAG: hypothetical protein GY867_08395 [bacterium]|nr:hypothetical protein [bacterium]